MAQVKALTNTAPRGPNGIYGRGLGGRHWRHILSLCITSQCRSLGNTAGHVPSPSLAAGPESNRVWENQQNLTVPYLQWQITSLHATWGQIGQ